MGVPQKREISKYVKPKKELLGANDRLQKRINFISKMLYNHAKNCKYAPHGKTLKKSIMGECEDHLQSLVDIRNFVDYLRKIANSAPEFERHKNGNQDKIHNDG